MLAQHLCDATDQLAPLRVGGFAKRHERTLRGRDRAFEFLASGGRTAREDPSRRRIDYVKPFAGAHALAVDQEREVRSELCCHGDSSRWYDSQHNPRAPLSAAATMIPVCKAPDPNTRKPKFQAPPGACDAHCHIFGPADRYPYAPDRSYTPPDAPLERFRELQATLGLTRAVLVNASCHGTDNRVILDAIAQSAGRYRGVANADDSFTQRDFEALHAGGCRGVRFNFVKHLGGMPDMDEFQRIVARVRPLGWHVDLHFDAGDLVEHAQLLET